MTTALIAAAGVLGAAIVTAIVGPWVARRATSKDIESRIGTPSDQGNVIQILERLVHGQGRQDQRHDQTEATLNKALTRLGRIERKQTDDHAEVCARLDALERAS